MISVQYSLFFLLVNRNDHLDFPSPLNIYNLMCGTYRNTIVCSYIFVHFTYIIVQFMLFSVNFLNQERYILKFTALYLVCFINEILQQI